MRRISRAIGEAVIAVRETATTREANLVFNRFKSNYRSVDDI